MVLIDKTMLEVSNGLRYVPVAKALKERRPNQSEATFNLQWQRLFRVFFLCLIKKDPARKQQFIIVPPVTSEGLSF